MLWFLRTLPLAISVGVAVGMSAAWHKASKQVAALESLLATAEPRYACAPPAIVAGERPPQWMRAELALRPAGAMLAVAAGPMAARALPPPAPAAKPAPCPSPAPRSRTPGAPPLPFTYLGKMLDGGELQVFLGSGDDSHIARPGQKIGAYRIEQVSAGSVTFTHLPSRTRQVLDIPALNE